MDCDGDDGEVWCLENEDLFEYLPKEIARSLSTRKDLRIGFSKLWGYCAECFRRNMLPTEENILLLVRGANEWPPHCRNFIQRGGAISSVVTMLFAQTMALEADGLFEDSDDDGDEDMSPNRLPTCRNDREIGLVSGMCGYERVSRVQMVTVHGKKIRH